MNPFSMCLKEVRLARMLMQKEVANIIGYEQSYVSALETGAKGAPKKEFLNQIVNKLGLTDEEKTKLFLAAEKSKKVFKLPRNADIDVYELCYQFEQELPKLSKIQVELINLVLKINHQEDVSTQLSSVLKVVTIKNSLKREAPKM